MEIVLKDMDGNDILTPTLYQWDVGVPIIITGITYDTSTQTPYLHFYNTTRKHVYVIGAETEGNALVYDSTNHTLTCQVPNRLLMEPYPITVHVYLTSGESEANAGDYTEGMTVFTASIGVEPRMNTGGYSEAAEYAIQHDSDIDTDAWFAGLVSNIADAVYDMIESAEGESF